jgi:hypothetical protein
MGHLIELVHRLPWQSPLHGTLLTSHVRVSHMAPLRAMHFELRTFFHDLTIDVINVYAAHVGHASHAGSSGSYLWCLPCVAVALPNEFHVAPVIHVHRMGIVHCHDGQQAPIWAESQGTNASCTLWELQAP